MYTSITQKSADLPSFADDNSNRIAKELAAGADMQMSRCNASLHKDKS